MAREIHYILKPYSINLTEGDCSPLDLFSRQGGVLLAKGEVVSPYIKELLEKDELYVLHGEWQEFRRKACLRQGQGFLVENMNWLYKKLVNQQRLEQATAVVDELQKIINRHPKLNSYFDMLRQHDHYTYVHSINVALLASLIGIQMGLTGGDLKRLASGALLHDIGKLLVPQQILSKCGSLTLEEYSIIKKHPFMGKEIVRAFVDSSDELESIRQHHERWNGRGYPLGLKGNQIHLYGQIVAVADVFDALTTDRPYRPGFPPYHAVEMIIKAEGTDFSPEVVKAFLQTIVLYPENTTVTLNTGEVGLVVGVPREFPTRPRVKVLLSPCGNKKNCEKIIDLQQNNKCSVSTVKYGGVKMRIMIIDDDRDCLEGLVSAIEPTGYDIEMFQEPEKAVTAYAEKCYDVVVTDMKMPGMNGIQVLKAIRSIDREAKVIVITGHGDVETAIASINNGAYNFFNKPVDIVELLEAIDKIAEEAETLKRSLKDQDRGPRNTPN